MTGLRRKLIHIVLLSGLMISVAVITAAAVVYFAQDNWSYQQLSGQLQLKLPSQVRELAASFLIPEQSAGRHLLLQRYSSEEGLNSALVLGPNEKLPAEYSSCEMKSETTSCRSADLKRAAILTPIEESGVLFGYQGLRI